MQNNVTANEIPIHDIKPLLEVHEYSLYYFTAIVIVATLLLLGVLYLIYRWYKNKNRFNIREQHYKLLNNIDYSDPKKAAYDITFYGATFKDDSERHLRAYENMLEKLEKYKYKKEVEPFDDETHHYIELFKGLIDV